MMTQKEIEESYSRRNIREHVRADIDIESQVYASCVSAVQQYMRGDYYPSKTKRIEALIKHNENIDDIIIELFIAVLPIQEISPIQSVAAQMANRLNFPTLLDGVKTVSEIIAVCESTGLYTIYHSADEKNKTGTLGIMAHYHLDKEVQDFISRTMYLPPMISEPKAWKSNASGGHLNGSGSVLLGAMNHHDAEQALDAINTIQEIPWELNMDMLELDERPNKPLDTEKKRKQFQLMANMSRQVYDELVKYGNKFYFVWKYCKRGRMYSQGYHVNLQSTEYKKAILQFHNKELLN